MQKITLIGAGNVGAALSLLLARNGHTISEIYSRRDESAQRAREIIGQGKIVSAISDLGPADILLIAVRDDALSTVAADIANSKAARAGTIAFHCSGSVSSDVLVALRVKGAAVASVHPVKTFTAPVRDAETFAGTWCGIEGDEKAVETLTPLFIALGGQAFPVDGRNKLLYHAGFVFATNYLLPLIEAGLQCLEEAGVARPQAAKILEPILHETIDNALRLGPAQALTGPIARGDAATVARQTRALEIALPELKALYEILGCHAANLAEEKGAAPHEQIKKIRRLLAK